LFDGVEIMERIVGAAGKKERQMPNNCSASPLPSGDRGARVSSLNQHLFCTGEMERDFDVFGKPVFEKAFPHKTYMINGEVIRT